MSAFNAEYDSAPAPNGSEGEPQAEAATGGRRQPRPKRPVVLVHIPKTAGTSLTLVLLRNETRDAVKLGNVFKGGGGVVNDPDYARKAAVLAQAGSVGLVFGHFPLGLADHLPRKWRPRYITFLRNPVERALSHYFQILEVNRGNGGKPGRLAATQQTQDAADDGLDELEAEIKIVEEPEAPDSEAGIEPLRPDMPYDEVLADLRYVPDNLHTRMLCGDPEPFGEVTSEMLERAKHNLEHRMVAFGLVERFDESIVLLKHRLGYGGLLTPVRRSNTNRPRGDDVPPDLLEAARNANRMDIELYEFGRQLFERAPERDSLEFQIDVAALRQAKADERGEEREEPPVPSYPGDAIGWSMFLHERVRALRLETQLAIKQRKTKTAESSARRQGAELAEVRELASRMRVRVTELSHKLEGRRGDESVELLRERDTLLSDQIAARNAALEQLRDRSEDLDGDVLDESELEELRAKVESVKQERAELVKRRAASRAKLRELGVDPDVVGPVAATTNGDSGDGPVPEADAAGTRTRKAPGKRAKKPQAEAPRKLARQPQARGRNAAGKKREAEGNAGGKKRAAEGSAATKKRQAEGNAAGKKRAAEGNAAAKKRQAEGNAAGKKRQAEGPAAGKKRRAKSSGKA